MGNYSGHNAKPDSSGWKQPVASYKSGEAQPAPKPMEQTDDGMKRAVTPDPYTQENGATRRNFGG